MKTPFLKCVVLLYKNIPVNLHDSITVIHKFLPARKFCGFTILRLIVTFCDLIFAIVAVTLKTTRMGINKWTCNDKEYISAVYHQSSSESGTCTSTKGQFFPCSRVDSDS